MSDRRTIKVTTINVLNTTEREAIRVALDEYISRHGDKKAWSQKVVLEDMLDGLLWSKP